MGKVTFHIAVSLDGFVAGPNDGPENGLGDGGERLHEWYFNGSVEIPTSDGNLVLKVSPQSAGLLRELTGNTGAQVWGRRTFDNTGGWGGHPPMSPCFVVTHTAPKDWVKAGSPFIFVTDGIESAIRRARQAAGDKDVVVCTPSIFQQCLKAGLMDEIHLSVVPVLLGGGVRLFDKLGAAPIELENLEELTAPGVTHLGFRVVK